MKSSRYTPEQVAFGLRQAELGTPVSEICRKMGISEQTFCRWTRGSTESFNGMDVGRRDGSGSCVRRTASCGS